MTLFLLFHLVDVFFFFSLTTIIVKGHGSIDLLSRSSPPLLEGFGAVLWPSGPLALIQP